MRIVPVLQNEFYHDGRGPELQKVLWKHRGAILSGFEYYNPDDKYTPENLKHVRLKKVEAYSMSCDEVHGNIVANGETQAAIHEIQDSDWLKSFSPFHLAKCKHFQIMFYDEIYDVICESIIFGHGELKVKD